MVIKLCCVHNPLKCYLQLIYVLMYNFEYHMSMLTKQVTKIFLTESKK